MIIGFIELTGRESGQPVWVSITAIAFVIDSPDGATIWTADHEYDVRQSAAEVMALIKSILDGRRVHAG